MDVGSLPFDGFESNSGLQMKVMTRRKSSLSSELPVKRKLRPPDMRVDHLPPQLQLSAQTDYHPRWQEVVHDLATL